MASPSDRTGRSRSRPEACREGRGGREAPAPQYPGALTLKLALLPIAVETPVTWRPLEASVVLDVEPMSALLLWWLVTVMRPLEASLVRDVEPMSALLHWLLVTVMRPLQREQTEAVTALPMAVAVVTAS